MSIYRMLPPEDRKLYIVSMAIFVALFAIIAVITGNGVAGFLVGAIVAFCFPTLAKMYRNKKS